MAKIIIADSCSGNWVERSYRCLKKSDSVDGDPYLVMVVLDGVQVRRAWNLIHFLQKHRPGTYSED